MPVRRPALVALLTLLVSSAMTAQSAVPVWQRTFRPGPASGPSSSGVIASRELADGTFLVVTYDLEAHHFAADGSPLGAQNLSSSSRAKRPVTLPSRASAAPTGGTPGYLRAFAAIDAFGGVIVSRVGDPDYNYPFPFSGDILTTKYDGLTGTGLWAHPAIFDTPGFFSADYPTGVFLDRAGDVVVTGLTNENGGGLTHVTIKYDGQSGALVWGPILIGGVFSAGTASLDVSGNVYVSVARSITSGGPPRLTTLEYDSQTGVMLWGPVTTPGTDGEDPTASAVSAAGDLIVVGGIGSNFEVRKLQAGSGSVVWTSSFPIAGQGSAKATAVALDFRGDVLVTGGGSSAAATVKLSNLSGAILWGPVIQEGAAAPSVVSTFGNGDVLVDPTTNSSPSSLLLARYHGSDGTPVWGPVSIGSVYFDAYTFPSALVVANGNVFVAAGFVVGSSPATQALEADGGTGGIHWGPVDLVPPVLGRASLDDLSAGTDGTVAVTGHDFDTGQVLTFKYDRTTGTPIWGPVAYGSSDAPASAYESAIDAAGNVFVHGATSQAPGGSYVMKYAAADGSVLWGPVVIPELQGFRVSLDPAGNPIVIGSTYDAGGFENGMVVKLSGLDGSVSWTYVYDGGGQYFDDITEGVSTDAGGNVFIAGSTSSLNGYNWWVVKLASADGGILWGPITTQPGVSLNMATDPNGDVVVTGETDAYALATIKYAGGSGAVLWGPEVLPSAGGWYSAGQAIAIDPSGDVFVSGEDSNDGSTTDFVTLKYRGSDGATLWGPVFFDGEGHGSDSVYPLGLELDAHGNPVVGGSARTTDRYYDAAFLKYDAATGATLWGPIYVGGPEDDYLVGFSVLGTSVIAATPSSGEYLTVAFDETFGIATTPPDPLVAYCQVPYALPFLAENGATPYTWSVIAGQLPAGMTLSSTGILAGTPQEQGVFAFTVAVSDAASRVAERALSITIGGRADPYRQISVDYGDPCSRTLSFPGDWTSYLWLPGGETTPEIVVSPVETTTYGLIVTEGPNCPISHSVTLPGMTLTPDCAGPSVLSVSPSSGPASGGTALLVTGTKFQAGAVLNVGGVAAGSATVVDSTQITGTAPVLEAGRSYPVAVVNPDTGNAALLDAWFADFLDVPPAHPFYGDIVVLALSGITAGCGGGNYCPNDPVSRAQMAVFLLRSEHGSAYQPPPGCHGYFVDVPCSDPFVLWIEALVDEGITAGCGNDQYCPASPVTRAQMAVFLLKTAYGQQFSPPPAQGIFSDVPPADPFAPWIEEIYLLEITGGCSANPLLYCPGSPTTRGQMAVFLVKTFSLQ
ncbi:MAG TPA: S-layer homology domain-containing protein [Thermoanaerobaculia bacterium]|nr:S-layer homology domain-containing protein [Thermoanaerobaculia bacterium]